MAVTDLSHSRKYLATEIQTATPGGLLVMLFDGAIRFGEQAKTALERKDYEQSHQFLVRAQHIVLEVMYALDRKIGEPVYSNLVGLYRFTYLRLVKANVSQEPEAIEEALRILRNLRETWKQAVGQASKESAGPSRPAGGGLSIQG